MCAPGLPILFLGVGRGAQGHTEELSASGGAEWQVSDCAGDKRLLQSHSATEAESARQEKAPSQVPIHSKVFAAYPAPPKALDLSTKRR